MSFEEEVEGDIFFSPFQSATAPMVFLDCELQVNFTRCDVACRVNRIWIQWAGKQRNRLPVSHR